MAERKWQDDLHLSDEEIMNLVNHEASEEVRAWWEIHRLTCQDCVEAFEMAEALLRREEQMPLEDLTPAEKRRALDRVMKATHPEESVTAEPAKKSPGALVAFLEKLQMKWHVDPLMPPAMAFRGRAEGSKENQEPLQVVEDESGNACLHIALGEDFAGVTLQLEGEGTAVSLELNDAGQAIVVIPANAESPLTLLLVEEQ